MARKTLLILAIAVFQIFPQAAEEKAAPAKANEKAQKAARALHPEAVKAVEIPGGVLFGDFSKEDGPFLLKGSIIVPSGQTLAFKPGCKIFMGGKYSTITVFGQLTAKGTAAEPVIFQSANKDPRPWDWDRIYCRSRNRSIFEHCIIRHSNYGIFVENGSARLSNCTFERNSLHGLVVKNSDVLLSTSVFQKGHVLAIFCQAGANVTADSLTVKNNITGVACTDKAYFKMERGVIKGNSNGIAVKKGASVNCIAADITSNKTGIVTEQEINKRLREMVYKNNVDFSLVTPGQMEKILKPPEEVKSIVLPKTKADIRVSSNFKSGFSALKAPREATASFIGNVSLGFKYFDPRTHTHPLDWDTTVTPIYGAADTTYDTSVARAKYSQNKYPGEHGDKFSDKMQPEIIFFAQGKRGMLDVNMNGDLLVNTWLDNKVKANLFTLSTNYAGQHFILGDYYENISETSVSGRKMRGIKYTGQFLPMGRGEKRMEFKLAAGETEKKKDLGDHEIELFNDTVDTGASIRQQLTYVANLAYKPAHNVTISVRGLISHDQDAKPLFTGQLDDTAVTDPISAATGCIDANVVLFNGKMEVTAELDMGAHDTVDTNDWGEIAWYKPQILQSIRRVFGVIDPDSNNYAFLLDVQGMVQGYDLNATFMEVAEGYYSAGNPYLEPDRRVITLGGEKQILDNLMAQLGYEYEQTSVSYTLEDDNESSMHYNTIDLSGEYSFGENKPAINTDYEIKFQNKTDMGSYLSVDATTNDTNTVYEEYDFREVDHTIGLEVKQRFSNGIDYSIKYSMRRKNDYTNYKDIYAGIYKEGEEKEDSWENGVKARFGFRIKRIIRNKLSVKVKYKTEIDDDSKRIDYKITDNLRVGIIPRKLTLTLKGEYRNQNETADDFPSDGIGLEQKTIQADLKYAITSRLSATVMGKYEDYTDEAESSTENYTVKVGGLHLTYLF